LFEVHIFLDLGDGCWIEWHESFSLVLITSLVGT
jgi:hypothetical protein